MFVIVFDALEGTVAVLVRYTLFQKMHRWMDLSELPWNVIELIFAGELILLEETTINLSQEWHIFLALAELIHLRADECSEHE